ncbi:RidA family protein [Ruegeria sp. A3M17]|nr:RidA family protein [Ruegeria sp. A3M17]
MTITRIETSQRMSRIENLLNKAGSDKSRVLKCEIWLAGMADVAEKNAVWDTWIPEGHAPARACGESKLARSVLKVEKTVTAAYS